MLPEAQLILAASRGDDEALCGRAPIDAQRVLALAGAHQVVGLIHLAHRVQPGCAPSSELGQVLKTMESVFWNDAARNELLRRDLVSLQQGLTDRRIDAMVLKGPFLAYVAYPHPGARHVGDIDLCLSENDYGAAVDLLAELGYAARDPLPESGKLALARAHHAEQLRFTAPGRRPVELHFRLVNLGPPRPEPWLWSTSRSVDLGPTTIRVPGPEAMLFHLALHVAQHGFAVLRLLHDIRFALEADGDRIDPDRLLEIARPSRCEAVVYHALVLARELAGARVPPALLAALRPGRLRRAWFEQAWFLGRVRRLAAPLLPDSLEAPRLYLLEMDTLRRRLGYLRVVLRQNGGVRGVLGRIASTLRAAPSHHDEAGPAGQVPPRRLPGHPQLSDDLLVFSLAERTLVHDPFRDRTVALRPGVRLLAELCTGDRSLGEIVAAVVRDRSSTEQEVVAGVAGAVMELDQAGFLVTPQRG